MLVRALSGNVFFWDTLVKANPNAPKLFLKNFIHEEPESQQTKRSQLSVSSTTVGTSYHQQHIQAYEESTSVSRCGGHPYSQLIDSQFSIPVP